MDLSELRKEIDEIDSQMIELFEKRMKVSEEVAKYKISVGKPVYDADREKNKIKRARMMTSTPFNAKGIEALFNQIMAVSRVRQYELISEHEQDTFGFEMKKLDLRDKKVVFQGVEGGYGHQAMMGFFGSDADAYHVPTFEDVMIEVQEDRADYGVLPVENTSTGIITDVFDLLNKYDNSILCEHVVKVEHSLLALPEAELEDIHTVFSHPQGLYQCTDFLDQHESWEQVSLQNTAVSAKRVKTDGRKDQAAIASSMAAGLYGLKVLEEGINNNKNNSTKFIIIKKNKEYVADADSISITFELDHETGSLYHILGFIIFNDLNMTKIESRPIQGEKWHYRFYITFDGNLSEARVRDALVSIQNETVNFKILGNFVREN